MELLNSHPIKKSDLGFHGNLFGGKLLSWIDAAAAGFAMQLFTSFSPHMPCAFISMASPLPHIHLAASFVV